MPRLTSVPPETSATTCWNWLRDCRRVSSSCTMAGSLTVPESPLSTLPVTKKLIVPGTAFLIER